MPARLSTGLPTPFLLQNVGSHAAMDVQLFFAFNPKRYALPRSHLRMPMLVPVSAVHHWCSY